MQKVIDAMGGGYLKAINWIAAHPHKTFWSGAWAILVVIVLAILA